MPRGSRWSRPAGAPVHGVMGAWRDAVDIVAWKRDLLTTDRVCLAVRLGDGRVIELHEEMARWATLLDQLPAYLPRCRSVAEWWSVVAAPAFAANPTVIYRQAL